MTVAELIEKLKEFDPNAIVLVKIKHGWETPSPDRVEMVPSPSKKGVLEVLIRPSA